MAHPLRTERGAPPSRTRPSSFRPDTSPTRLLSFLVGRRMMAEGGWQPTWKGIQVTGKTLLLIPTGVVLAAIATPSWAMFPGANGRVASHAKPTSGCGRAAVMKSVFPKAEAVGFSTRSPVRRAGRRHPYWPGWCGNWRAEYKGYEGHPGAYAQVLVSLYKTRSQALVALAEPAYGKTQILPNGVRMRSAVYTAHGGQYSGGSMGAIASVARNVFISSLGCCGGRTAVRAQMQLHRRIQAAVLGLG